MSNRKKKAQRGHAKRRAAERYGIRLHQDLRTKIVRAIQSGAATLVERQSNRVSIFDVETAHDTVRVVYDHARHEIVTFIPKTEPPDSVAVRYGPTLPVNLPEVTSDG